MEEMKMIDQIKELTRKEEVEQEFGIEGAVLAYVTEDGRYIAFNPGNRFRKLMMTVSDVRKMLPAFNEAKGGSEWTFRQIIGSSGPVDDFVIFYMENWEAVLKGN
jgi:hypothetical protein